MPRFKNLKGLRFGRLLVIERVYIKDTKLRGALWRTVCDCGNEKITSSEILLAGKIKSCGCLRRETTRELNITHDIRKKLLLNITVNRSTGCWEWTGYKSKTGYGIVHYMGDDKAHRIAYKVFIGEIEHGNVICHKCDNPSCINPEHLVSATQAYNIADMDSKGRRVTAKGSRNANAKLSESDVKEARIRFASGEDYKQLMNDYGYKSHASFYNMINGVTWGHVK